jgi:plasmid stability protein
MPANLHVRNVDDDLILRLKRQAADHGRSAEAEHREILRKALTPAAPFDWIKATDEIRAHTVGRPQTPSEVLVRESRDER